MSLFLFLGVTIVINKHFIIKSGKKVRYTFGNLETQIVNSSCHSGR